MPDNLCNEPGYTHLITDPMLKLLAVNKFALQIQSRKNFWVNYTVVSDAIVEFETKTDEIPFTVQSTKMNTIWLHVDASTGVSQVMEVIIRPNRKCHLSVSLTDTLNNVSALYTVRKKNTDTLIN